MTDKYVIYQIWGAEDDKKWSQSDFFQWFQKIVFLVILPWEIPTKKKYEGGTFSAKNLEKNFKFCFLMQFHNGTLDVEYSQSIFSTFWITLLITPQFHWVIFEICPKLC